MTGLRWAGIAGILFAVLFVFGVLTVGDAPVSDESDTEVAEYYEDSGNRTMIMVSAYIIIVSALALLVFNHVGPYSLLGGAGDEFSRHCTTVGNAAGIVAAGAIALGAVAFATVPAGMEFQDVPLDVGVVRFMMHLGFGSILLVGGLAGALSVGCFSVAALRTGRMVTWLGWLGIVCAIALLFGVLFLPMVALPLWVLVAGVMFLIRERPVEARAVPAG